MEVAAAEVDVLFSWDGLGEVRYRHLGCLGCGGTNKDRRVGLWGPCTLVIGLWLPVSFCVIYGTVMVDACGEEVGRAFLRFGGLYSQHVCVRMIEVIWGIFL